MSFRGCTDEERDALYARIIENRMDSRYQKMLPITNRDSYFAVALLWRDELISIAKQFAPEQVPLLEEAFDCEWGEAICTSLNEVWMLAPDHGSIHGLKGWDVLCDLSEWCEEECVIETPITLAKD